MNRTAVSGDALLAFRLAHWLDLLAAKAPAGGVAAQPVSEARAVDNDVRLPSHAAVVLPLPRELRQGGAASPASATSAVNVPAAELSVAARALNTVLAESPPQAAVLRGSAPLWPSAERAPSASGWAAALAQTVSESGLFYESHVAAFAAGARSLEQLEREPQARLAPAVAAGPAASTQSSADPVEPPAQSWSAAIHPQAAPLVHQQLDLLESGAFRWSGEAWPGVPMDWSIREEGKEGAQDQQQKAAKEDAPPPASWSTTVSLTLPRMGRLDLRLTLAASKVRAHIAAHDARALAPLRGSGAELSRRLAAAGLQVQALQFAEVPRP
ncbi:flagellar hook-length control protein FliK [Variovorax sp. LARHSF232]